MKFVQVSILLLLTCLIIGTLASDELEKSSPKNDSMFFSTWRIEIRPKASQEIDSDEEIDKSEMSIIDRFFDEIRKTKKSWWEKANVCVDKKEVEEIESPEIISQTKSNLLNIFTPCVTKTCFKRKKQFICVVKTKTRSSTTTLTITHQCCHGFKLVRNSECEKLDFEMLPLVETIQKLNGNTFLQTGTEMYNVLENGNVTVFLPPDDISQQLWKNRADLSDLTMNDIFLSHITSGYKEMLQPEMLNSLFDDSIMKVKVIVLRNDENVYLVNCAKVIKSDNFATNGVVHTIDRQLVPVTKTIMSIVKSRKNLSSLKDILEIAGLSEVLDNEESWTLMAPTNEAFEKLEKTHPRLMLMLTRGNNCALNVLKHHIIGHDLCTQQITLGANVVQNTMGEFIRLGENATSKQSGEDNFSYYLNEGVEILESDVVATNGVVHIIDEVIIPESVTSISTMLLKHNLTMFHQLLKTTNLLYKLDQFDNLTIMAPTNMAIKRYFLDHKDKYNLQNFVEGNKEDNENASEFNPIIFHHIIDGAESSVDFQNNEIKQSIGTQTHSRINLYSTMPMFPHIYNRATIDCAKLIKFDIQQCGNIVHVIDKILVPYTGTMLDKVKNTPELSTLYGLLPGTKVEEILKSGENITFVAPTNKAFSKIKDADYELLKLDKEQIDRLLKQHVLEGVTCTSGLTDLPWPFDEKLKSLSGKTLSMGINMIGGSTLTSTDHMARNGVIHHTDTLMMVTLVKRFKSVKNPNVDISLINY